MGAWIEIPMAVKHDYRNVVAPLVGAWIEILLNADKTFLKSSLPSWERGLKFCVISYNHTYIIVAPLVGAWIEINVSKTGSCNRYVAPLVGAWIEMHYGGVEPATTNCRSPRGSVD